MPSQIDYILISSRWATSVRKAHVKWGISCHRWGRKYDHGLVCCTLISRMKMQRKATAKLDISLLKVDNQLRDSFDECMRQNLSSEQYDQNSYESLAALTNSVSSAASSTIPKCSHLSLRRRNISSQTRELYASREPNYNNMTTE